MTIFILNSYSLVTDPSENTVNSTPTHSNLTEIVLIKNPRISNRKNKKKFDLAFHRRMEKHFPDWSERMSYQKTREEFYKSAMKKQAELRRTGMMERPTRYTKDELDAVAYFEGTGFYSKVQDSEKNPKPCIYDTRQSFLIKMQDNEIRRNFLKSFNRLNS